MSVLDDLACVWPVYHACSKAVQGARAQEFVKGWTWQNVALQYSALVSEMDPFPEPLTEDPFKSMHFSQTTASWHESDMRLLSGQSRDLTADTQLPGFRGGRLYALYVDNNIQVI